MVEIEYVKFTFLDTEGMRRRTAFGIIIDADEDGMLSCVFPFESFTQLRKAVNEEKPSGLLEILEEFNCREEAEASGLLLLNGEYVELPESKLEVEDE